MVAANEGGIKIGDILTNKNMRVRKIKRGELPYGYVNPEKLGSIQGKKASKEVEGGVAITFGDVSK